jgi:hypothetical protein
MGFLKKLGGLPFAVRLRGGMFWIVIFAVGSNAL